MVSRATDGLSNKFIGQVEPIFKNLPKPLKCPAFLLNGLILLTDIPYWSVFIGFPILLAIY